MSLQRSIYLLVMLGTLIGVTSSLLGRELVYQALVVAVTGLVLLVALQLVRRRGGNYGLFAALASLPMLIALSVPINGFVSGNHVYLVFLVTFLVVLSLDGGDLGEHLLQATNVTYVVYLAGSLLVYFGVVELTKGLNIFDAATRVPWLRIKTLVGLYGSTAHIDSISLFVALLNLAFGKPRRKWAMVVLALAASALSVRYTPFAALAIALVAVCCLRVTRRSPQASRLVATVAALVVVFAPFLLLALDRVAGSPELSLALDRATNGRIKIWSAMLEVYANDVGLFGQLFGTAVTEQVYEVGGWPRVHPGTGEVVEFRTSNPHNTYLAFMLSYGLVPFLALVLVIAYCAMRFLRGWRAVLFFFVLAVGITNAELMTFHFPVYVAWAVALGREQLALRPARAAVRVRDPLVAHATA